MRQACQTKGMVLIATLFTSLLVAVLVIGLTSVIAIDYRLTTHQMQNLKAYYVAEAGVADALDQIRSNGEMADTSWQSAFPAGESDTYDVSISNDGTLIRSQGVASALNFARTIEVEVIVSGDVAPYRIRIEQWKEVVQ